MAPLRAGYLCNVSQESTAIVICPCLGNDDVLQCKPIAHLPWTRLWTGKVENSKKPLIFKIFLEKNGAPDMR